MRTRSYNPFMGLSSSGSAAWRVFLIQLAIFAALLMGLKLYLPHRERVRAAEQVAERERRIDAFFQNGVEEDPRREVEVNGGFTKRHPQRLRATPQVAEVEATLGAPDTSTADFRGGQHLTWIGTAHQLQASFNAGRLYCLVYEDRSTGEGVMVFESAMEWHPYNSRQ